MKNDRYYRRKKRKKTGRNRRKKRRFKTWVYVVGVILLACIVLGVTQLASCATGSGLLIRMGAREHLRITGQMKLILHSGLTERVNWDKTPPIIEAPKERTVTMGSSVAYKKDVTITDENGEDIKLEIDNSDVDMNTPGEYTVIYSATDAAGNTATTEMKLIVSEKQVLDEEYVRPMVEKVVNQVINDNMSDWDKAHELFQWVRRNLEYGAAGDRSSIWAGAYEGIHDHSGDCYAYYGTYAAMLEVAGIDYLEVRRVGGETNHWWLLVNLGNGWYHCDPSPKNNDYPYKCFMQTDAQVAAYTKRNHTRSNYYVFDESLYPERATKIVYGN